MKVYENGVAVGDVDAPELLAVWAARRGRDIAALSLDIAEVRQFKVSSIRGQGREWYAENISPLEANATLLRSISLQPLSPDQTALKNRIDSAHASMELAIQRVRAALTWQEALAVEWAYAA